MKNKLSRSLFVGACGLLMLWGGASSIALSVLQDSTWNIERSTRVAGFYAVAFPTWEIRDRDMIKPPIIPPIRPK